jgi:hypothetical protein
MEKVMNKIAVALITASLLAGYTHAATSADGTNVLYEDAHIRFVEVVNRPGVNNVAAVQYPAIVFTDSASPESQETPLDAAAAKNETRSLVSRPGDGAPYPRCHVQSPIGARKVTVTGTFPQRYYRIDYKRVDGKAYGANWRTWYQDIFGPLPPNKVVPDLGKSLLSGKPHSKAWPYDIRYNAIDAAPANHTVRYQDEHIELIEVGIRQGETEHMHGHPYYSIFADDGGFWPDGADYSNYDLSKSSFQAFGEMTSPMNAQMHPRCWAATPQAPHAVTVKSGPPQHFYRIHFKRIVGDSVSKQ